MHGDGGKKITIFLLCRFARARLNTKFCAFSILSSNLSLQNPFSIHNKMGKVTLPELTFSHLTQISIEHLRTGYNLEIIANFLRASCLCENIHLPSADDY